MEILEINGEQQQYIGAPLVAFMFDGDAWAGRSNFLASNQTTKNTIDLTDLQDCFKWMKKWSADSDYKSGYILDFSSKTVYYDTQDALVHLKEKKIPKRKWDNYFTSFKQMNFAA